MVDLHLEQRRDSGIGFGQIGKFIDDQDQLLMTGQPRNFIKSSLKIRIDGSTAAAAAEISQTLTEIFQISPRRRLHTRKENSRLIPNELTDQRRLADAPPPVDNEALIPFPFITALHHRQFPLTSYKHRYLPPFRKIVNHDLVVYDLLSYDSLNYNSLLF